MPELIWKGKRETKNYIDKIPLGSLIIDENLSYNAASSHNMIIEGDNLIALKTLTEHYEGKIDCIYLDPPYNTGLTFLGYNDNVASDEVLKYLYENISKNLDEFDSHDRWLCVMYPRLFQLRKLLSENGAIFISIDFAEEAHLKLLMDEVFGGGNFVTKIAWRSYYNNNAYRNLISNDIEPILIYAKNKEKWLPNNLKHLLTGTGVGDNCIYDDGIISNIWCDHNITGDYSQAYQVMKDIFSEKGEEIVFMTPKPVSLIKFIIKLSTTENSIILDAYGGSGATAQSVIDINHECDKSSREYIVIEMDSKTARNITRERIIRVISSKKNISDNMIQGFKYYMVN